MNSISKLENGIRKILDENSELKAERNNLLSDTDSIRRELNSANALIESLRNEIDGMTKKVEKSVVFEAKKTELIGRIESIIERVELLNIDDITND